VNWESGGAAISDGGLSPAFGGTSRKISSMDRTQQAVSRSCTTLRDDTSPCPPVSIFYGQLFKEHRPENRASHCVRRCDTTAATAGLLPKLNPVPWPALWR